MKKKLEEIDNTISDINDTSDTQFLYEEDDLENQYEDEEKKLEDSNEKDYSEDDYLEKDYSEDDYSEDDYSEDDYSEDDYLEDEYMEDDYLEDEHRKEEYVEDEYVEDDNIEEDGLEDKCLEEDTDGFHEGYDYVLNDEEDKAFFDDDDEENINEYDYLDDEYENTEAIDFEEINDGLEDETKKIDEFSNVEDNYIEVEEELECKDEEILEIKESNSFSNKVIEFTKKRSVINTILVATGVLIATVGIAVASFWFVGKNEEEQVTAMSTVGEQLSSISTVGGTGLKAITNAYFTEIESTPDETESEAEEKEEVTVSFISYEKDLKVKFINNETREQILGVEFEVILTNVDEEEIILTDTNCDGIIHEEGLIPGEYQVIIQSVSGFEFPNDPHPVKVKDQLEYQKIDIMDEVKDESEINPEIEDAQQAGKVPDPTLPPVDPTLPLVDPALPPVDPTLPPVDPTLPPVEVLPPVEPVPPPVAPLPPGLMIDVSKHQGDINWQAVRDSGVDSVIIRCGYRGTTSGALIEDQKYRANIEGATAAGLKVGVYVYSQALNEVEAIEEASMALGLVSGYNLTYPIFIDAESSGGRGDTISVEARTANIKAFAETVINSGYKAGVYSNKKWFDSQINTPELTNYTIWLAHYAPATDYNRTHHNIWQYSDSGSIPGISTGVDMNINYLGY